jgi:FKBP-type peptidyl-prolyl cis-trans isomerase FkpA
MLRELSAHIRGCLIVGVGLLVAGCSDSNPTSSTILPFAPFSQTDLRVGDGAQATPGRTATVNYTGWLYDPTQPEQKGREFDTSTAFTFQLGVGRVIPGWDLGVAGMKVGGQRRLIIPPDLGYGSAGAGTAIPPNATLVFDVELLEVQG